MTSANFVVNATPASAANLVISEVLYDPTAANAAESMGGDKAALAVTRALAQTIAEPAPE